MTGKHTENPPVRQQHTFLEESSGTSKLNSLAQYAKHTLQKTQHFDAVL